ncbi:aminotransferase class I/II-fold pyridoxal phosphate-dependent enzyme, partial [Pseudomonas aeruginosa]
SLSTSVAHRVLQLAEQHDFHIVKDDIYADFQNGPSTRLATLDSLRRVIYLASFLKTLSCSLRVGYLIDGPELIRPLADVQMFT